MYVLVGDIGGTKTSLALARVEEGGGEELALRAPKRYASASWPSLTACVREYLTSIERAGIEHDCELAAFAIAGPVQSDRCAATNLAWVVDARELERDLGLRRAVLLNDLEAIAWAVPALGSAQLLELQPGDGSEGNACVIAAGTGLGEAGLFWDGREHRPFATEGGHADFAPVGELELALHGFLRREFGRISWERVVSGMGIAKLYAFLLEHRDVSTPAWLLEEIEAGELPAAVADAAVRDACPICVETMALLFELYGREAGNLALKHMALGGVYLAGGVTQRNLELLQRSAFVQRFCDKGRMSALMQRMPVRVILDPHAGLRGAARSLRRAP
jgi:glucokinase